MESERNRLSRSTVIPLVWVVLLWAVLLLIRILDLPYRGLTLQPHKLDGLAGILTAPFLHVDWGHLISNSLPLFLLGTATIYFYPKRALSLFVAAIILPGIGVWFVGQSPSFHLGVSGVVFALTFFLLLSGIIRGDRASLTVSLAVIVLYGGSIWGIFPGQEGISWEYHLFGALVGVGYAMVFRQDPSPLPPPPTVEDNRYDNPLWDYKTLFPPPEGFQYPEDQQEE